MKTIISNSFVMSATPEQLLALAAFLAMSGAAIAKAQRRGNLAQVIGTKIANSSEHSVAFAAGTLELDMSGAAPQPDAAAPQPDQAPPAGKRSGTKSAKSWIRELLDANDANGQPVELSLAELISLTGKTEVNIRTMLSDLRSSRYCGKDGVFATRSVRRAGKVFYSKA